MCQTPAICAFHYMTPHFKKLFSRFNLEGDLQCGRPGFDPWVGKIPWRRKWQPTPVFLPGESHGQRSLEGYSPRRCKELDKTERLHFTHLGGSVGPHFLKILYLLIGLLVKSSSCVIESIQCVHSHSWTRPEPRVVKHSSHLTCAFPAEAEPGDLCLLAPALPL